MKKTFTANISGTVFHIEEDAYDQLHRYLANIRAKFSGSTGSDEILSDIEARVAELFTERLQGRQVVTIADVEHVQQTMGQPEDFASDESTGNTTGAGAQSNWTAGAGTGRKRLFRDPEDQWVGGVLSGISAYFNLDPLWLRIAFVIIIVLGWGSPVAIYLVLWIMVPKADTPADRLRMRGEPVTVDNLKKAFDHGAEKFTAGAQRMSEEARDMGRRWKENDLTGEAQRNVGRHVRTAASALGRVIGAVFLVLGVLLAFGLIMGNFGRTNLLLDDRLMLNGNLGWGQLSDAWFISPELATWAWLGVVVLVLVPIIGLIAAGIRLLFDVAIPRWFGWVLSPLWILSIFLLVMIGLRHANEFRYTERVTDDIAIPVPADGVLHIAAGKDPLFGNDRERYSDNWELIEINDGTVTWGSTELDVKESPDSLFHLRIIRKASGSGVKQALNRARSIAFEHSVQDNLLTLSPLYSNPSEDKLRGQSVLCIVQVPMNKAVRFERGTARIIHDIDNTTNTWDPEMVGRTWTMTPQGLSAGIPPEPGAAPMPSTTPTDREAPKATKTTVVTVRTETRERTIDTAPPDTGLLQALHSLVHP
ncbi:MAG TPA: PspC domain-containing protein [Flavobacteriales bacterium]